MLSVVKSTDAHLQEVLQALLYCIWIEDRESSKSPASGIIGFFKTTGNGGSIFLARREDKATTPLRQAATSL